MDYKSIQYDIRAAALQFGLYAMGDKGVGEVMEMSGYKEHLGKMSPEDAAQLVIDVMEKTSDKIVEEGACAWANGIVMDMDYMSDDWFGTFLDYDTGKLSEFY